MSLENIIYKTELVFSLDRDFPSKKSNENKRYMERIIPRLCEKVGTLRTMHIFQNLSVSQKKGVGEVCKKCYEEKYAWNHPDNEMKETIDEILLDLKTHKKYFEQLKPEQYPMYERFYRLAKQHQSLDTLYSFDCKELCKKFQYICKHGMDGDGIYEQCISMMPYFSGSYFLHTLSCPRWYRWYESNIYTELQIEGLAEDFCKPEIQNKKFLRHLDVDEICVLMRTWKRDHSVLEFMEFMDGNACDITITKLGLEKIKDFSKTTKLLMEAARKLKGVPFRLFYGYMFQSEFNIRIMKKIIFKLDRMDETAQMTLFQLPLHMITAWILERWDIISLAVEPWHEDYETLCPSVSVWDYISKTNIIQYALVNKKRNFLNMIVEGEFSLDELAKFNSVDETIYKNYINLNMFNAKELRQLINHNILSYAFWKRYDSYLELEGEHRNYNATELLVVSEIIVESKEVYKKHFFEIFMKLLSKIRSETACIRMRQYIKALDASYISKSVSDYFEDEVKEEIIKKLILCDLPRWKRLVYPKFHASNMLIAESLPVIRKCKKVMQEALDESSAYFIITNPDLCAEEDDLNTIKKKFITENKEVLWLKENLGAPDRFYEEYKAETSDFFVSSNLRIANAYLRSLKSKHKYSVLEGKYKIVLKAALSGKLKELRYHGDGLSKECSMNINEGIEKVWTSDSSMSVDTEIGGIQIYEDTSFNGIMNIGVIPGHTCMNYIDGIYLECLLSYFDGNKKVVYIKDLKGKIIARAVMRLTKMTYDKNMNTELDFSDVTNQESKNGKEIPVIFLERMYTGFQDKKREAVEKAMFDFVKKKADEAGVEVAVSDDYMKCIFNETFTKKQVGIYITKSKAGCQYLDSFGGKKESKSPYSGEKEDVYYFGDYFVKTEQQEEVI